MNVVWNFRYYLIELTETETLDIILMNQRRRKLYIILLNQRRRKL